MKPIYLILLSVLLTGCLKETIRPVLANDAVSTVKKDSVTTAKADTANTYDWYNGTTGTALIKVTCSNCTAIATIGGVSTPFLFNAQGVGELKYTPTTGLSVYIAVCPAVVEAIKADIFDKTNTSLYSYSGVSGNWNYTYVVK